MLVRCVPGLECMVQDPPPHTQRINPIQDVRRVQSIVWALTTPIQPQRLAKGRSSKISPVSSFFSLSSPNKGIAYLDHLYNTRRDRYLSCSLQSGFCLLHAKFRSIPRKTKHPRNSTRFASPQLPRKRNCSTSTSTSPQYMRTSPSTLL